MSDVVNVIVTCTKKKTRSIPDSLMLRNIRTSSPCVRTREWVRRLEREAHELTPVRDLYAGDHWSIARELEGFTNSLRRIHVWVVSAGYGLVSLNDAIKPYSATFSRKHPDSVVPASEYGQKSTASSEWWDELTAAVRVSGPNSLAELASESPKSTMLVIASEIYLTAIRRDLLHASRELKSCESLSIFSAGTRSLDSLNENLVPCDARLQYVVRGVRRSLNIRLARKAIQESRKLPTLPLLRHKFLQLLKEAPEIKKYNRHPMSDEKVARYIKRALVIDSNACHSHLLRQLRADGYACEQSRFRSLFHSVQDKSNDNKW